MGQKVHPIGFRLGVIRDWESKWFADKAGYTQLVGEDLEIRQLITRRLANASVSKTEIERHLNEVKVTIHTAKPGIVIGKQGAAVEDLRKLLEAMTGKKARVNIMEIRNPEIDSRLVARSIAEQLERRVAFRRAMKQAVQRAERMGAKGIRIKVGGRLGNQKTVPKLKLNFIPPPFSSAPVAGFIVVCSGNPKSRRITAPPRRMRSPTPTSELASDRLNRAASLLTKP